MSVALFFIGFALGSRPSSPPQTELAGGEGYVPTGIELVDVGKPSICATNDWDAITNSIIADELADPKFGYVQDESITTYNHVIEKYCREAEKILASRKDLLSYVYFWSDAKEVHPGMLGFPEARQRFGVGYVRENGKYFSKDKQRLEDYYAWSTDPEFHYKIRLVRLPQITEIWSQKRSYNDASKRLVLGVDYIIGWHSNGPEQYNWVQDYKGDGHYHTLGYNMQRPEGLPKH